MNTRNQKHISLFLRVCKQPVLAAQYSTYYLLAKYLFMESESLMIEDVRGTCCI